MKVVVDTNVLISGFLWQGTPKKTIDKFRFNESYELILSPELLHEFETKLLKRFRIAPTIVKQWMDELARYAELVIPNYTTKVCRDEKDNMVLDTTLAGKGEFIVTGDKDLLSLGIYQNIKIVTPSEFLSILNKQDV